MQESNQTKTDDTNRLLLIAVIFLLIMMAVICFIKSQERQAVSIYTPNGNIPLTKKQIPFSTEISIHKTILSEATLLQFCDLFADDSQYKNVMNILAPKGHCHPITFKWIDYKKSYKSTLVAILKELHSLNYYKSKRPTALQIQEIALNTFGVEIGIDTIKTAHPKNKSIPEFPPASFFA